MRDDAAPFRPLIWLAAAVVPWLALVAMVLWLPQALAGLAVAGVVLWRVPRPVATSAPAAPARVHTGEDVRTLVAQSA